MEEETDKQAAAFYVLYRLLPEEAKKRFNKLLCSGGAPALPQRSPAGGGGGGGGAVPCSALSNGIAVPYLSILCDGKDVQTRHRLFYFQEDMVAFAMRTPLMLCATDMGLGKTLFALSLVSLIVHNVVDRVSAIPSPSPKPMIPFRRVLFLCSKTLIPNITGEFRRHFRPNSIRFLSVTDKVRKGIKAAPGVFYRQLTSPGGFDVLVMAYSWFTLLFGEACELVFRASGRAIETGVIHSADEQKRAIFREHAEDTLQRVLRGGVHAIFGERWYLFCDEAQAFNNENTKLFKAIQHLKTQRIVNMGGRLQENRDQDIRSLFLAMGIKDLVVTSDREWQRAVDARYENRAGGEQLDRLLRRHMIRFRKEDVLRKRTCLAADGSGQAIGLHRRALEAGRPVPPSAMLLEDVAVDKIQSPFQLDCEVEAWNLIVASSQRQVERWKASGSGSGSGARYGGCELPSECDAASLFADLHPFTALLYMRQLCFSLGMFDPVTKVRAKHMGREVVVVAERWWGDGYSYVAGGDDDAAAPHLANAKTQHHCEVTYRVAGEEATRRHDEDLVFPPALILAARLQGSTKLGMLRECVKRDIDGGVGSGKSVIFVQWWGELLLIQDELRRLFGADSGRACIIAYGKLDEMERQEAVTRFRADPECRVFVAVTKIFGTGLNLSFSDRVYYTSTWYNPCVEAQGLDRCDRYGQKHQVRGRYLMIEGTVERRIFQINREKLRKSTVMLDGFDSLSAAERDIGNIARFGVSQEYRSQARSDKTAAGKRNFALELIQETRAVEVGASGAPLKIETFNGTKDLFVAGAGDEVVEVGASGAPLKTGTFNGTKDLFVAGADVVEVGARSRAAAPGWNRKRKTGAPGAVAGGGGKERGFFGAAWKRRRTDAPRSTRNIFDVFL